VVVEAGAVVPPDSVLPPFTIWRGSPAQAVTLTERAEAPLPGGEEVTDSPTPHAIPQDVTTQLDPQLLREQIELPPCWMEWQQDLCTTYYRHFLPS